MNNKKTTSWGAVADWYDSLLTSKDSFQNKVILPNLLRLMEIKSGEKILDVGCGTGFFAAEFSKAGAKVSGIDVGEELLVIARKNAPKAEFKSASAEALPFGNEIFDKVVFVLALQNMADMKKAVSEAARTLKSGGKIFLVLNHPAFRIPKQSDWVFDEEKKIQYRRIDKYLSELKEKIQTHPSTGSKSSGQVPGDKPEDYTISFHRPLQFYFKALNKSGFAVRRLEEWNSHKQSEWGPRQEAEDIARKEIPLFLMMEAIKLI